MSKMGAMGSFHKSIRGMMDSLQKLDPVNHSKIGALQKAGHNLDAVKSAWYKWMEPFDFELKNMDAARKVDCLRTNLTRI